LTPMINVVGVFIYRWRKWRRRSTKRDEKARAPAPSLWPRTCGTPQLWV